MNVVDLLLKNISGMPSGGPGLDPKVMTPGIGGPVAPPQGQPGPVQGGFNKLDSFLQTPGGGFLMNLLAQSGYSKTPGSPVGAIGRASIMTQQQEQQKELLESRLGVGSKSPFGLVDRAKYTKESVAKFEETGRQSDLVLRGSSKPVSSDQSRFEFYESLTPEQQKSFMQLQRAAPRPSSVPGAGYGVVDPATNEFIPAVEESTIVGGLQDRERSEASGRASGGEGVLSTAEKAVDNAYGKTFVDWTQNGEADAVKGLSQLKAARDDLATKNVTGPVIGGTPEAILKRVNPVAADTKAKVEEVVQRNLRLILGAQFTEKEGERLISRAFDQSLPEETNVERVDRLIQQIESSIQTKQDQARYYSENGTLKGWQGQVPTLEDFDKALDDPATSSAKVRKRYNPQTGKIEIVE